MVDMTRDEAIRWSQQRGGKVRWFGRGCIIRLPNGAAGIGRTFEEAANDCRATDERLRELRAMVPRRGFRTADERN